MNTIIMMMKGLWQKLGKKVFFRKKHAITGISLPSIELKGNYDWFFFEDLPNGCKLA